MKKTEEHERMGQNRLEPCVNRVYRNQIGADPKGNIERECV